jgi:hypothetical protein
LDLTDELETAMTSQWQYQVRFDLIDQSQAEALRRKHSDPSLKPLSDILAKHHAAATCQFDAFADYVAAAEAEGVDKYPLHAWTKATIENPTKKEKYLKSFTVYGGSGGLRQGDCGRPGGRSRAARRTRADHTARQVRHQPSQQPAASRTLG